MKLHKCGYCDSQSEPLVDVSTNLLEVTAIINCPCGAKVTITVPTDTYLTKAVPEKILSDHVLNVARDAWNTMHH